jgi:hypothetical protein
MARETPEPTTPPTAPDDLPPGGASTGGAPAARTFEGTPDLVMEDELAAAERESALRGRGRPTVAEPTDEQPER